MKRYFINAELRFSSIIILILMVFFYTVTSLNLNAHQDKLKQGYIDSVGAIAEKVIEKNPELEKDIMPVVTKEPTQEESKKGRELLKQYGVTPDLENNLFPYTNKTLKSNRNLIICIFILITLIFLTLNYLVQRIFYNRVRKLTSGAKKVMEGEYDIDLNENTEGDFSKLAISFNSMKDIIRNNMDDLNKEKQFLVDLLSDISHQLKTPLSSMIIYNDIMQNNELPEEKRKTFLLSNQNQLERMNGLIKSILKLAKLDAKAIELNKENQSMNETIQAAIDALTSKAIEGGVEVIFNDTQEIFFEQDNLWLEEAFINIIKNAIEHTQSGGVIKIELTENPLFKRVTIEDTGEGIKEEDLPNIFKRFYKTKNTKKSDSIGIGLALSKSIVEAHSGIIDVTSKVGLGTKFTITFVRS
jgi:signal transduction histidine kinase